MKPPAHRSRNNTSVVCLAVLAGLLLTVCANNENPLVVMGTLERDRIELIAEAQEPIVEIAMREGEQVEVLEFVWNNLIVPLMEEYFYSQRDRLAELLAPFRTDVEPNIEDAQDMGLDFEIGRQTGDDLVIALAKLAERGK